MWMCMSMMRRVRGVVLDLLLGKDVQGPQQMRGQHGPGTSVAASAGTSQCSTAPFSGGLQRRGPPGVCTELLTALSAAGRGRIVYDCVYVCKVSYCWELDELRI